ncbi:unnamed protein product [Caenorhabditis angaria]|uniref:ASD2 domain-containing protein n=1 Tax=Caenorhabditis angaria TaxID=860376 RepID=A0A9P1MYT9_9PELO|nr:unnamed protein product [Caenorhabditis angaria]
MDYDCDTLQSAKKNRAASQQFYQYLMTPTRTFLPHDHSQMLHRSPSGAKRKIRQKREEAASRPSPFLSPSSSSSTNTTNSSPTPTETSSNYRSLIDSGDYQSIMPDFVPEVAPPVPTPRLSVPFSNSMSSLELSTSTTNSSSLFSSSLLIQQNMKPTVEVHPMPVDERSSISGSSLSGSIDLDIYKPKPPVPVKPKGLLIDHLNRSTSMTSLTSPVQHTTSAFLSNFMPTPSLINLQQGYRNPDLGSQDLAKLENTRHESIQKVSRKLSTYEEEKSQIENELDEIERTGSRLLAIVEHHNKNLAAKIRRCLENSRELIAIETNLRLQMSKLDDRAKDGAIDKSAAHFEESRLRRRFQETDLLRKIYMRREKEYEKELSNLFNDDEYRRWCLFKDASTRLLKDDTSVDYCIRESRMKLDALHLAPRTTA